MNEDKPPPVFQSFDPRAELLVSERNLPHWFQPGAAIFVTFRTADSMPSEVILRWRRELEDWLRRRGLPIGLAQSTVSRHLMNHEDMIARLDPSQRSELQKRSDQLFHRSLDACHGACVLRAPEIAKTVGDAMLFHMGTKYELDRLVVMPNHVHAIVQFYPESDLSVVSQSWMRYSARQINQALGTSGPFWQPEPFDHIIRSPEQFRYLQQYILDNPAKAKLRPGEFLYRERAASNLPE
ncbi:transposase [Rhodopirellula baltica]